MQTIYSPRESEKRRGGGHLTIFKKCKEASERGISLLKVNFMVLKEDKRRTRPSPLVSAKRSRAK